MRLQHAPTVKHSQESAKSFYEFALCPDHVCLLAANGLVNKVHSLGPVPKCGKDRRKAGRGLGTRLQHAPTVKHSQKSAKSFYEFALCPDHVRLKTAW